MREVSLILCPFRAKEISVVVELHNAAAELFVPCEECRANSPWVSSFPFGLAAVVLITA